MAANPTACMIIIGNEILSGRTQDKNLGFVAAELSAIGVDMKRAYIIPDDEGNIVRTVNEARAHYDYVFTSGGIGPTHDDITTSSIAKAFNVPVIRDVEALKRLEAYYDKEMLNEQRLSMADVPQGARLIDNPVSAAPGYCIENVYVLAGVPKILQAMMGALMPLLKGGVPVLSRHVSAWVPEGDMAHALGEIQTAYPQVDVGSYPMMRQGKVGVSLVARSSDAEQLEEVIQACHQLILQHTDEIIEIT